MKKTFTYSFFWLLSNLLTAQVNMGTALLEGNNFPCQPGVVNKSPGKGASFSYAFNPDYRMQSPDAEKPTKVRRNERFDARLKIPVVYSPKLKVMVGLDYTLERYHFLHIDPDNDPLFKHLNETDLKNAGVSASIFRPINHKYYATFRLSANWQGDYGSFLSTDNRYAVYRLTGVFGVKKRANLEYGAGILLNKGYRGRSVVPFGFYNQTFNKYWGIEAVLPTSAKLRYNFNERRIAMFGAEFSSQNYALNVGAPSLALPTKAALHHFRRASLDVVGTYYHHLSGWAWLQLKVGYAFDNDSDARDLLHSLTHQLKPSGSMIGMVSFFLSPPKQCVDKAGAQIPTGL